MLQDQRFFNGPSSAISPSKELSSFSDHMNASIPQTPLNKHTPDHLSSAPMSATVQDGQGRNNSAQEPSSAVGHGRSASSGLLSPSDPGRDWPLERVLKWLDANSFSSDWQETFRGLNIEGADFLDLGRANNGRGNFGMMHQHVYPKLARICGMSGSGWNQERERNEGRRLRRLVRKIAESADAPRGHGRRESSGFLPSASTDGGVESSPNLANQDSFNQTPSTAGGGEDSPNRPFRSAIPGHNPRMASKNRSSTLPLAMYNHGGAASSDSGLAELSGSQPARPSFTRGILSNINDAASKRHHSPSASSDTGTGSTFIGDAIHNTYEASPQSGSPSTQHALLTASTGGGTLSAPPHGRLGHRKTGSSDSATSRRNGGESHRSLAFDVASKHNSIDAPTSAKELSKGFLDRFKKRKKDNSSSHPSPEDHNLESPTSPHNMRHLPPSLPFAKSGMNNSSTSLERPSSASTQMSEHDKIIRERAPTRDRGSRRYVFVTPDQWNYRLVDITEAENAPAIREAICKNLNYSENDIEMVQLYLTEPGQIEHDETLSDAMLLLSKHTKADSTGTLKFYVRRGPTSASLMPPPLSAGLGIGMSPKASPPAGSLFPRKAVDEDGYNRVRTNGRIRSRSPPMTSRQNTLRASDNPTKDTSVSSPPLLNGDTNRGTESSEPVSTNQIWQNVKAARESSNISDVDWGTLLQKALIEHQQEMERKGHEPRSSQSRRTSGLAHIDINAASIKSDKVVNLDAPRRSPYEVDKKQEPLVPLRKPPAPPTGSQMLEKANSLTRKAGDSLRSSVSSQSDLLRRRSGGSSISEEIAEIGRSRAVLGGPSPSGGIGAALVGAGDVGSSVGKLVGSRRNMPALNTQVQGQNSRARSSFCKSLWGQPLEFEFMHT